MDGVLAQFNESFINRIIGVTGVNLFPSQPFDIPEWHYPQAYGYTEEQLSKVWDSIEADKEFWLNLRSYPETIEFLWELEEMNHRLKPLDVYFITNRAGVLAKYQTERWLRSNGWLRDPATVLISGEKGLCCQALKIQFYIDDNMTYCRDVLLNSGARVFMLARTWNEPTGGIKRLAKIKDFLTELKGTGVE